MLEQLDDQARDFHGLSADVERTKVTVVVNDKSTESGTILVHGDKMRLELKNPDERTILRTGDSLFIFNPKLNRVEEFNLGKYKAFADQYLLLGFGTPGRELKKGYLVTLLGEPVIDGKKVAELELTPKSEAMRDQISKIQLWFDETTWLPVQQQFFETGSEDYFIVSTRTSFAIRRSTSPNSNRTGRRARRKSSRRASRLKFCSPRCSSIAAGHLPKRESECSDLRPWCGNS